MSKNILLTLSLLTYLLLNLNNCNLKAKDNKSVGEIEKEFKTPRETELGMQGDSSVSNTENQEQQESKLDKIKKEYKEGFDFLQESFEVNLIEEKGSRLLNPSSGLTFEGFIKRVFEENKGYDKFKDLLEHIQSEIRICESKDSKFPKVDSGPPSSKEVYKKDFKKDLKKYLEKQSDDPIQSLKSVNTCTNYGV